MPRIKTRVDAFRRLLGAYELDSSPALARVLDCSRGTALRRIRQPDTLTVGELRRISTHGHVPVDELRAAL